MLLNDKRCMDKTADMKYYKKDKMEGYEQPMQQCCENQYPGVSSITPYSKNLRDSLWHPHFPKSE